MAQLSKVSKLVLLTSFVAVLGAPSSQALAECCSGSAKVIDAQVLKCDLIFSNQVTSEFQISRELVDVKGRARKIRREILTLTETDRMLPISVLVRNQYDRSTGVQTKLWPLNVKDFGPSLDVSHVKVQDFTAEALKLNGPLAISSQGTTQYDQRLLFDVELSLDSTGPKEFAVLGDLGFQTNVQDDGTGGVSDSLGFSGKCSRIK